MDVQSTLTEGQKDETDNRQLLRLSRLTDISLKMVAHFSFWISYADISYLHTTTGKK